MGVSAIDLLTHRDGRGELTEIFRTAWAPTDPPVQSNLVRSGANTLRGIHVHLRRTDYVAGIDGRVIVGLKDLRRNSPTYLKDARYELKGSEVRLLNIPPGVGHGFYFPVESLMYISVTHYFDPEDELGYRWDDPTARVLTEAADPIVSDRDAKAPALADLLVKLEPHQADLYAPPAERSGLYA